MKDDVRSLSHSKWRCKYHIVFAPKYRRQIIYRQLRADIGKILRELSERKGVEIIEAECCPDHIHMLVAIPPHLSVSAFMGYLKSKSSLMIFDRHAGLKYKYGNRHFWCRGYYVDTVGKYDYAPFVRYMLGILVAAYREFSSRVELLTNKSLSKPDRVREIIRNTAGKITKNEIMTKCPDISQVTVQRALADLVAKKEIIKIGGGRYTSYAWNHDRE